MRGKGGADFRVTEKEFQRILKGNPTIRVREQDGQNLPAKAKTKPSIPMSLFDSQAEERYYNKRIYPLLLAGQITRCDVHQSFEVIEAVNHGGKRYQHRIFTPDFILHFSDGSVEVGGDQKPEDTQAPTGLPAPPPVVYPQVLHPQWLAVL